MAEITITAGNVKIESARKEIMDVSETPDGVAFSFKGGLQILYTDPYMKSSAKQIIKNTADNIKGKRLIFELDNPKIPARVDSV